MSRVRDHWSIGEVLSLLQDEFPEVTISKIRFLESQGLIDPERTPSGYRKFSDSDYDRLYWILEQQRDHYLPLRVIRDRLEEGQDIGQAPRRSDLRIGDQLDDDDGSSEEGGSSAADEDTASEDSPPAEVEPDAHLDHAEHTDADSTDPGAEADGPDPEGGSELEDEPVADPNLAATLAATSDEAASPESPESSADLTSPTDSTTLDDGQPRHDASAEAPVPPQAPEGYDPSGAVQPLDDESPYAEDDPPEPEPEPEPEAQLELEVDVDPASESAGDQGSERPAELLDTQDPQPGEPEADSPPDSEPVINVAPNTEEDSADTVNEPKSPAPRLLGTRTEKPRPTTKTAAEALAPSPRPSLPGSSVALTHDELAEQSGSTPGMVAELEKYGMINPRQVGTTTLFDSTALTVARLAVQFGRYGLEPRHLKTFRLGAEREVALLTQSIGPTLKANNPETRRRSYDTLQDLAELSASLRSIIVRDLVADLEPGG